MNRVFFLVLCSFFLTGTCSGQIIRLINTTRYNVTLKIQNEVTYEFDKLTLSAESTVEFESSTMRRVTVADKVHFYALNELKEGVEQITINQLAAKNQIPDEWDEEEDDDETADIVIENLTEEKTADLIELDETVELKQKINLLEEKLNLIEEKLKNLESYLGEKEESEDSQDTEDSETETPVVEPLHPVVEPVETTISPE